MTDPQADHVAAPLLERAAEVRIDSPIDQIAPTERAASSLRARSTGPCRRTTWLGSWRRSSSTEEVDRRRARQARCGRASPSTRRSTLEDMRPPTKGNARPDGQRRRPLAAARGGGPVRPPPAPWPIARSGDGGHVGHGAAVPEGDRPGQPAHRRGRAGARPADRVRVSWPLARMASAEVELAGVGAASSAAARGRRRGGPGPADPGQPAPRGVDRQALRRPGDAAAGPRSRRATSA